VYDKDYLTASKEGKAYLYKKLIFPFYLFPTVRIHIGKIILVTYVEVGGSVITRSVNYSQTKKLAVFSSSLLSFCKFYLL
jgi:hypothetical protein